MGPGVSSKDFDIVKQAFEKLDDKIKEGFDDPYRWFNKEIVKKFKGLSPEVQDAFASKELQDNARALKFFIMLDEVFYTRTTEGYRATLGNDPLRFFDVVASGASNVHDALTGLLASTNQITDTAETSPPADATPLESNRARDLGPVQPALPEGVSRDEFKIVEEAFDKLDPTIKEMYKNPLLWFENGIVERFKELSQREQNKFARKELPINAGAIKFFIMLNQVFNRPGVQRVNYGNDPLRYFNILVAASHDAHDTLSRLLAISHTDQITDTGEETPRSGMQPSPGERTPAGEPAARPRGAGRPSRAEILREWENLSPDEQSWYQNFAGYLQAKYFPNVEDFDRIFNEWKNLQAPGKLSDYLIECITGDRTTRAGEGTPPPGIQPSPGNQPSAELILDQAFHASSEAARARFKTATGLLEHMNKEFNDKPELRERFGNPLDFLEKYGYGYEFSNLSPDERELFEDPLNFYFTISLNFNEHYLSKEMITEMGTPLRYYLVSKMYDALGKNREKFDNNIIVYSQYLRFMGRFNEYLPKHGDGSQTSGPAGQPL